MANVKFGVIGIGYFGKHYVRLLQEIDGVTLHAVANSSEEAFERLTNVLSPCVKRCRSGEELTRDSKVECVVIATPVASHFSLASRALEEGKHVLVEKPMTRTLKEAEALKAIIERSGRVFMVGHQYLYNDSIRHLKRQIEDGVLGRVRYVFAEHLYPGPIRSDIGCFWETAPHEFSIIDYLLAPGKIQDVCGRMVDICGSGRDDFAACEITFENGLFVTIVASWFAPEKVRRMIVGGEKGMAVFDERDPTRPIRFIFQPYPHGRGFQARSHFFESSGEVVPKVEAREPLRNQLEHFIECVRANKPPLTDIGQGVRIVEFLDVTSKAIASGLV